MTPPPAKTLSPVVERAVVGAGPPPAFVGVVIAAAAPPPEGPSSLAAARADRLQTALNLSPGGALASIGLTIPTVAAVSLIIDKPLSLGLAAEHAAPPAPTLGTGRMSMLQGGVHLVIFGAFLTIAAAP